MANIEYEKCNIWDKHDKGYYVIVTTNGIVKKDGCAVMGGGIALEAAQKFPKLPSKLGHMLDEFGNQVFIFPEYRLVTLPTKNHFKYPSDIRLIRMGLKQLYSFINHHDECKIDTIYSPLLGCGLGGLNWEDVSNEIYLDYLKFNGRLVFVSNV